MGIQLYRKGDSHTIRGVVCEMTVTDGDINTYLADGWVKNEQNLIEAAGKESEEDSPVEEGPDTTAAEERAKAQTEREMAYEEGILQQEAKAMEEVAAEATKIRNDDQALRSKAKEAGISHYWNKSKPTLEKELKELQEE